MEGADQVGGKEREVKMGEGGKGGAKEVGRRKDGTKEG